MKLSDFKTNLFDLRKTNPFVYFTWPLVLPLIILILLTVLALIISFFVVRFGQAKVEAFFPLLLLILSDFSYIFLIKNLRKKQTSSWLMLMSMTTAHLIFGTLGIVITWLFSGINSDYPNQNLFVYELKRYVGLLILSMFIYSPVITFLGLNKYKNQLKQKINKLHKIFLITGFFVTSTISLFFIGLGTVMLLSFWLLNIPTLP